MLILILEMMETKQKIKVFMQLAGSGFLQVFFVIINTYFVSTKNYIGVLVVGFIISLIWSFNVKRVAFGNTSDRLSYAFGASIGSLSGLIISVNFF